MPREAQWSKRIGAIGRRRIAQPGVQGGHGVHVGGDGGLRLADASGVIERAFLRAAAQPAPGQASRKFPPLTGQRIDVAWPTQGPGGQDQQGEAAQRGEHGRHGAPVGRGQAQALQQLPLSLRVVAEHPLVPAVGDGVPAEAQVAQPGKVGAHQ
jgi:hypothetical protein